MKIEVLGEIKRITSTVENINIGKLEKLVEGA